MKPEQSRPLNRAERRALARGVPPRLCGMCGANLAMVLETGDRYRAALP